jgi:hypothetical protein
MQTPSSTINSVIIQIEELPLEKLEQLKSRIGMAGTKDKNCRLGTKRMGQPSTADPCTPRAERPPRQPRTLSVTVVGCSMGIWARTLRVDRGVDGLRAPSGAHFVVCSLLVLGPKYQILPSMRFRVIETPGKRNA